MNTTPEPQRDDPEIVQGEVVRPLPVRAVDEPPRQADAAIEAAALHAMAEPGIPGRDEFLSIAMQARILSMSDLAPRDLRHKPYNAFLVLMVGRALGIDPTSAMRKVYVVDGQPSVAPQLIAAVVRRQGLGQILPDPDNNDEWAAAWAFGPGGMDPACKRAGGHRRAADCSCDVLGPPSVFTWEDAIAADLVSHECTAAAHTERCRKRQNAEKGWSQGRRVWCKDNWRGYPRRMLWWRAVGYCADDYFPEAGLGLYSPDELGAVTDDDGRAIDPATVELPDGYERGDGHSSPDVLAPEGDRADIARRIAQLPDEQRAVLRERWMGSDNLRGFKPETLTVAVVNLARSMVSGFESIARKSGWTPPDPTPAPDDPVSPATDVQDSPDTGPGPSEPDDPANAPQDHQETKEPTPKPDPVVAAWVRQVIEAADADVVEDAATAAKEVPWQTIDRELRERGFDPSGRHIDERRMLWVVAAVRDVAVGEHCHVLLCDTPPVVPDEHDGGPVYCAEHEPF